MKKITMILSGVLLLTGCSTQQTAQDSSAPPVTAYIQDSRQLYITETTTAAKESQYKPINYTGQAAVWLPYTLFGDIMQGKTADEFRSNIANRLDEEQSKGMNTVYFHVHPFGDAYYNSDIFPKGSYLTSDFDPLAIVLEEAHARKISVHAWINPLRCQTTEEMSSLPDDFIVKKWYSDPACRNAVEVNGRVYLNPASEDAVGLIADCANEIISRYDVDGLHIDDYFYPTTDPEFDRIEFEASGAADLTQWRLDNSSRFVKALYDTVKSKDSRLVFGISPQGNINSDMTSQYADVKKWTAQEGYCDYIAPQLYFGFLNTSCPFDRTLQEWENLTANSSVSLIAGLAPYKLGREDKWAGAGGELEWIECPDMIDRQLEVVRNSTADGFALYY